jgi:hypothetical protein
MMHYKNIRPFVSHCILDGARMGVELNASKRNSLGAVSLYRGMEEERLGDIAPYLVGYRDDPGFEEWFFEKGWGKSWGIFFSSGAPSEDVRKHFRKFLLVKDEDGRTLYFRFYDPRVLRVFLPTCSADQLGQLFGPIDFFVCEDKDPTHAIVFSLKAGQLQKQIVDLMQDARDVKGEGHIEPGRRTTRDVIV